MASSGVIAEFESQIQISSSRKMDNPLLESEMTIRGKIDFFDFRRKRGFIMVG